MSDAEELTYGRPSFGVMLDGGGEDGWRKQHAAQAWQVMQCWLLMMCAQAETDSFDDCFRDAMGRLAGRSARL